MAKRLKHRDRISDLTIDISVTDLQKARDYIAAYPERVLQSARRAANKTADSIRSRSFKLISQDYTIKQKNLRASIQSAGYKGGAGYSQVLYSGKKIEAQYFKHNPKRVGIRKGEGVSVQFRKDEPMKVINGSFLAHAPNGIIKIYKRKYYKQDEGKRVGIRRLPIVREFGSSPASMIRKESIPYLVEYGEQRYIDEFIHEMREGYKHGYDRRY